MPQTHEKKSVEIPFKPQTHEKHRGNSRLCLKHMNAMYFCVETRLCARTYGRVSEGTMLFVLVLFLTGILGSTFFFFV